MKNVILIVFMSVFLVACGGSSASKTPAAPKNPEDNTKVGVFIDAPVKGLAYTSLPSGKKGITNEKGEFEYIDGDMVTFSMGSIELGQASPDSAKKVKVTQLKQALLVAQLLQVLDNDVNEDRIDVSDITIPEAVKTAIVDKLQDKDGDANTADIVTEEQLVSIKSVNPKKLTLQQRVNVVSKEDVLKHVKQQIGTSDLTFSASELNNLFLIENSLINKFDGIATGFSVTNSPATWIYTKNHSSKKTISAKMSKPEWEIDSKGNLVQQFEDFKCVFSKINEDVDLIDVSYFCIAEDNAENGPKGLMRLIKPQPFSANDLSGKSFNFKSLSGKSATLTFGNNGTLNCNDDDSPCNYKDHPSYKNAVWIEGAGDSGEENALMILAQGSLAKGKLLMIHYKDDGNTLNTVEVMKVSGNTLMQVFESDNLEGSSANGITSGNIVFPNNVPDNAYIRITPAKFQKGGNTSPNYGDSLRCKVQSNGNWGNKDCWISEYGKNNLDEFTSGNKFHFMVFVDTNQDKHLNPNEASSICFLENDAPWNSWSSVECSNHSSLINDGDYDSKDNSNSGIQNPSYIPFAQEMISGKTLYNVDTDDAHTITIFFGAETKGQAWDGLTNDEVSPDVTFDYHIDSNGYLILSNVAMGNQDQSDVAIGLIEQSDKALKLCWGDSVTEITGFCKDNDIKIWYKTKKDAETAVKEHQDNDTDENTDDNSDSNDNPNAGTQNPNYSRFTQEMISGKTLYNVYTDWDDDDLVASTFTFDDSGKGKAMRDLHDSAAAGDTFDYLIDNKGYLILSNWVFKDSGNAPEGHQDSDIDLIGLIEDNSDSFKICWGDSLDDLNNGCDGKERFYKTKAAAKAALAAP